MRVPKTVIALVAVLFVALLASLVFMQMNGKGRYLVVGDIRNGAILVDTTTGYTARSSGGTWVWEAVPPPEWDK